MKQLTKENFWNSIESQYPMAMRNFYKWIDQYKTDNNWDKLFNGHAAEEGAIVPKYHELPNAMQFGIFMEFAHTCVAVAFTKFEHPDSIEEYIDRCMEELHDRLIGRKR